jgi:hypothetical protein
MSKYCPENERVKRDYTFWLETSNGKQNATIDAALRAIERFEASTNWKPFRKFHVEQARSFRARLAEETNAKNRPLSAGLQFPSRFSRRVVLKEVFQLYV